MHSYGMPMQYGQHQQQMWDYYNTYPGQQQQPQHLHMQQQMMDANYSGMDNSSWWQQQHQMMTPGGPAVTRPAEYSPNFRPPSTGGGAMVGMQSPGSWMLRGSRPRNDRRGPGRPRIGPGSSPGAIGKPGSPVGAGGGGPGSRPRLMSPPPPGSLAPGSFSPFSSEMGSPSPVGASETTPGSPSPSGFDHHHRLPTLPPDGVPGSVVSSSSGVVVGSPVTSQADIVGGPVTVSGKAANSKAANANKKRYTCEICGKKFSTAWYVRVHRKSHSGERPYVCHNCGKGFMLPNVLQVHLRKCEKNNPGNAGSNPQPPSTPSKTNSGRGGGGPPVTLPNGPPSRVEDPGHGGPGDVILPQSSPALPQQGFLDGGYNGGGGFNQRYDMGVPGGMPTPPFHQGPPGPGGMFDPQFQEQHMYGPGVPVSSSTQAPGSGSYSNAPAHFLANDRPPDEGGGFNVVHEMCTDGSKCGVNVGPGLNSKMFMCSICDKRFHIKGLYDAHVKTAHQHPTALSARAALIGIGQSASSGHHQQGTNMVVQMANNGYIGSDPFTSDLPPSPSFSPGIPTPQSSLDSLSCFNSGSTRTNLINSMGSMVSKSDPLSELTATVEAAVPHSPPPSLSSNASSVTHPIISS